MDKRWSVLTTVVCVTLMTSACSSEPTGGILTEQTAISVEVASVKSESLDAISSLTGTLSPYKETTVSFEVGGNIQKMDAEIGDQIKMGTSLTSLNSSDYELQVAQADNAILQAEAALTSSDSAIDAADVGIQSADVGIQSADANVSSSDEAIKSADVGIKSADAGVKSADVGIQSADVGIKSADVGVKSADANVSSTTEAIKSAQANIKAANARINSAQANLDAVNKGAREQEKAQARTAVNRAKDAYNKLKTDAERIKGLYDEGLASKKEYDDIQLQVSNAKKDLANAEQSLSLIEEGATEEQRKQARAGVEEAKAGKEQAEAGVGQAEAAKKQAEAAKKQAEAAKEQAQAAKEQAQSAKGQAEVAKEQAQAGKGQAQAGKGQAVAARDQAVVGRDQAVVAKDQAIAAKGQAEAVYEQAMIGKEQAELTLSKTKLKSPITGVVLEKLASEGQHVNPGDAIYKLGQTDQLKVLLPVPDKEIKEWKAGDKVSVTLYGETKSGKVTKLYPQTNASTGTISVEVVIPNEKLDWVPGQVVKANRVNSDNKGILVPIEAVISNGSEPYVFKVVKGKALKVEVQTGNLIDNKIHIVSGLKEDDQVVIRGGELLLDGSPVETDGGTKQ